MKKYSAREIADTALIIFLCFSLIFFSVGTLFLSSRERVSQVENRPLTMLPPFSAEAFLDGSFSEELGDAYRDGIPFRSAFLKLRGISDLILQGQVENVMFGKDGYLIPRGEYDDLALFERNTVFLEEITKSMGKKAVVATAPRPIDVGKMHLSSHYSGKSGEVWEALGGNLGGEGLSLYLSGLSEDGEEIWYKTDHHWTTSGAYYAYSYLGDELGYAPYGIEDFDRITVTDSFLGSSYSLTGGIAFSCDKIELFRYDGDGDYLVMADGEVRDEGLYAYGMLERKDKYGVFLGGNYGRVTIDSRSGKRERLLIIKDSYANSLVPFLARHFDIEMIDPRYFSGEIEELYALAEDADRALILQGIDTLATTSIAIN